MPKPYADPARKAWPFLALFVLVGLGLMTPFVLQGVRDWRIARVYEPTEAEILSERTVTSESTSKLGGRWMPTQHSHTEFTWSYQVNHRHYVAVGYDNHDGIMMDAQETGNLNNIVKDECWYDPAAPEKSVLVRQFRAKFYLGALIPGSFILVGGVMLLGVLRHRPMKADAYVSEGEHLRHRLSPVLSTRGILGCLGAVVLLLGLAIVLLLPKVTGEPSVYLICIAIEGFLIHHLWRAAGAARVPDPVVEIADEPLSAGQTTALYIRHPGPAQLASLQVQVICEKVGQSGTRSAHKHLVLERDSLTIAQAAEFNDNLSVPAKASPSLKTVQTATTWCVRIRRKLGNGVSYDTDYPFRVVGKTADVDAE